MLKRLSFLILLIIIPKTMYFQTVDNKTLYPKDIYEIGKSWADSVYNSLSEDERIAQLFWIAIENPENKTLFERNKNLIEKYKPGGILLFRMSPQKAREVIDEFQTISKTPLVVSIDGENGLAMRFPDVVEFPRAMTLGAIKDDNLIFQLGVEIAKQCQLVGIHVNMAPVADINSNPKNPVIGVRSYGENPENVARKSTLYMQGLQHGGVMAVAKHFPGHGDTDTDSHETLPIINHDRERLDTVEFTPFKSLIDAGIWGIMSAHLHVPALENTKNTPASFSNVVLKNILRNDLNFKGLVISDAVNMKGAKTVGKPGEIDALALLAGNDIVLFTENLPEAIKQVKEMVKANKITIQEIENKCKRSLSFKYYLTKNSNIEANNNKLIEKLNSEEAKNLNKLLNEAAITLLINNNNIIPLKDNKEKITCLIIGEASYFEEKIKQLPNIKSFNLSNKNDTDFQETFKNASKKIILVVADDRWSRNTSNNQKMKQLLDFSKNKQSILIYTGNIYNFADWKIDEIFDGVLINYQKTKTSQEALFNSLTGRCDISGRLPVSINEKVRAGDGLDYKKHNK